MEEKSLSHSLLEPVVIFFGFQRKFGLGLNNTHPVSYLVLSEIHSSLIS